MTVCGLGPQVFLNCAGFIKIDTAAISDTTTDYIEVLDGSRVHPETYEWAKKMAVDALEYDEVMKFYSNTCFITQYYYHVFIRVGLELMIMMIAFI